MRQLIEIQLSAEAQKAASSQSFRVGIKNATNDDPAEIEIYGEIGDQFEGCDARSISAFLRSNRGKAVNVRLNSPGGLAYDGITIHNALLAHDGPVKCIIDGMAGSAASVIAMAGQPLQMYENAQLFIHRASVIAIGNVDMMDEAKNWLSKIDDAIARTYKAKTGKAYDKIMSLMKGKTDGTVFTAREAKDAGFIDEILSLKNGNPIAMGAADLRSEAEQRLSYVESAKLQRIRSRRELFAPTALTAARNVVPENPPGGNGTGVEGAWNKLRAEDFTDKGWAALDDSQRRQYAKYFAWYSDLASFGNLHLGHHFGPNHSSAGKPSLEGVRAALSRLNQVQGMSASDRAKAQAHLETHLPQKENASTGSRSKPLAQGGPMYDVGDMVKVMEDGQPVGQGEVRSSTLGYMYCVMQADGTMLEDCCEDDLMPMGEEVA